MSDEEIIEIDPEMLEDEDLFLDEEDELDLIGGFEDEEGLDFKPTPEEE